MLLRSLAVSYVVLCPAYAAAQQLPDAYVHCRNTESPDARIAAAIADFDSALLV